MTRYKSNKQLSSRKAMQGFTLVELMVSIGIIVLLSVTLLVQQNKFDSVIFLKNTAQEVAIAIRQAQMYATRGVSLGTDADYPYGIYVNITDSKIYLFQDEDDNGYERSEVVETYSLSGANTVGAICWGQNESDKSCSDEATLQIIFKRPDPDAIMTVYNPSASSADYAEVKLESADNTSATIVIRRTGQISVE